MGTFYCTAGGRERGGGEAIKRELALTPLRTARTQLRGFPASREQSAAAATHATHDAMVEVCQNGRRVKSSRQ